MATLCYTGIMSLDGYIADADGTFDWSAPTAEVHAFVNNLERPVGTYLLGRRMYEVMSIWQTLDTAEEPDVIKDYAEIWRGADKLVYSTTLEQVSTPRTTLASTFDAEVVRTLKRTSRKDISVGGAHLAAEALRAGLVDELHMFMTPVIVGNGTRYLPDDLKLSLELLDEHRFTNGVIHLHYRVLG
jgi:dihydrofolate reductase